jgi:CRP-like cAMP-binding protein
MALIDDSPRNATVVANTGCRLAQIADESFADRVKRAVDARKQQRKQADPKSQSRYRLRDAGTPRAIERIRWRSNGQR